MGGTEERIRQKDGLGEEFHSGVKRYHHPDEGYAEVFSKPSDAGEG